MFFPITRLRRLRLNQNIRDLIKETEISVNDLIYPMFLIEGKSRSEEIESMPGIFRHSIDNALKEIELVANLGIKSVLLFGIPQKKDDMATGAYSKKGIVQKAVKEIKKHFPDLVVITDLCLCEYTDHGHCGVIHDGYVDNDETLELLSLTALSHAEAGADIIAPSDMMDGRVAKIREVLDDNEFHNKIIMSYSAKYASAFYGPFRDAAQSAPQFGDRKSYQMNPPNIREALREIEQDIEEGADIIMVKPALSYLDVISAVREEFNHPLAAYNVSGEYSMVKAASKMGWIDENKVINEMLTSIKRAGADLIITYFAKQVADNLPK
ncbi:MAG: porphobilinogen synthase [Candidatus Dadabacteria bacterium]|nr:porphobilinogen synthase [Candidatus Dadabacteria bacterium]NIS09955.1 porphobilinogen synthase [Candidatus Dadabacteria bacterium]NIV42949.1 porphobilinogen synthase [Candidatus Dadabacteria bacterium]NIY22930.1 porphobilinogen synthase [Candidatus Dadabacteria bacterium]